MAHYLTLPPAFTIQELNRLDPSFNSAKLIRRERKKRPTYSTERFQLRFVFKHTMDDQMKCKENRQGFSPDLKCLKCPRLQRGFTIDSKITHESQSLKERRKRITLSNNCCNIISLSPVAQRFVPLVNTPKCPCARH
ncbi:hypothetical protein JOB18_001410 [Solea senegalensis]|uniref:Uncharacterized protein n=1 Tax=Solea senegalensis TaxID=28829 RepID=A0AAV6SVK7_SOLSE|nr:hypothetical protein JOB18_001410 [Solea senegalensis]